MIPKNVREYISRMKPEDINDMYELLKNRHGQLRYIRTGFFSVGDRVSFIGRRGRREVGKVTKLNQKTVTVLTDTGARWRVSSTALEKVK